MTMKTLHITDLEQTYDQLAMAIDDATPARSELFLTKLVLLLAHELADPPRFEAMVREAQVNLGNI